MSFSKVCISGKRADPDRVYYNATVINNNSNTVQQNPDPFIRFQEARQTALIYDSSSYKVSVENFSISGGSKNLPIFIPQIADPTTDVDTTIYTVTVAIFDGTNYNIATQPIIWVAENQTVNTPKPSTGLIQQESEYYYCYTYSHWTNLVNAALIIAYGNASGFSGNFGTKCPFMQYDSNTSLFSIFEDANTCLVPYGQNVPPPFSVASAAGGNYNANEYSFVGMNVNLENLLTNFSNTFFGSKQLWEAQPGIFLPEFVIDMGLKDLNGVVNSSFSTGLGLKQIITSPLVNPFTNAEIAGTSFVQLTQDYNSTGSMWSPIASFVIGTSQIPVRNEDMADPVTYGASNMTEQNGAGGAFQKVLIETPINAVTAEIWRGWILYQPLTPTYSTLDPTHQGLTDIDFQVFWRNRISNSLIPMRMSNKGSMTIRLLFEKK